MENQIMTTIYVEPDFYLQMDGPNPFGPTSPILRETATDILLETLKGGFTLDMQGSFTYSPSGEVTGTITKADYYGPTSTDWRPSIEITGNIDAHTCLVNLVYDPLATFFQSILHGGDNIEGGSGGPNHLYGFAGGGDYIVGGYSGDWLVGYGGNNLIVGVGSNDFIDGGPGVNKLFGGIGGANTFICSARNAQFWDVIGNFVPRSGIQNSSSDDPIPHDVVDLMGLPGLHNFHQVMHHEFIYHGAVAIHDNIGDVVVFANIHHKAQLHPYDFHFFA
jgi:hypothetical protein